MHYYNRHLGDYSKDTGHLTLLEHGVYTVLLDWTYATEKALPEDTETTYRICRATTAIEKRAVDAVLAQFFPQAAGARNNKRATEEIAVFRGKSAKARQSVADRWNKHRNTKVIRPNPDGSTTAEPPKSDGSANQSPVTNIQTEAAEGGGAQVSDLEILAWAARWPGEPPSGTPRMPVEWVTDMLTKINGRTRWPDNWARWLIACWRQEFRTYVSGGRPSGHKKNAPVSASVAAISLGEEEDALAYEINALRSSNLQVPPEKLARWKVVKQQLEGVMKPHD